MTNQHGYHPHKKPHKGCIGYVYCKRMDMTMDIGADTQKPDKRGFMCSCEYFTRLDPFNHEVVYYDEDNTGRDYAAELDAEPEVSAVTVTYTVLFWKEQWGKEEETEVSIKRMSELDKIGQEKGWYAWSAFKNDKNIYNGGKK